jgi:transcriptional regulator with XRE-family HTH domain
MSWRIRIARQSVNMSQQGLAKTLGVHRDTISSWETGKTEPSAAHLAALSHETGIPYAWLRYGYGDMTQVEAAWGNLGDLSISDTPLLSVEAVTKEATEHAVTLFHMGKAGMRLTQAVHWFDVIAQAAVRDLTAITGMTLDELHAVRTKKRVPGKSRQADQ